MENEFKYCNYCGELMFCEDIDKNGKCKKCNNKQVGFYRINIESNEEN